MKALYLTVMNSAAILSLATACGSAKFGDGSSGKPNGNATGTPGYTGQKVDQLTWFWQCDSAPASQPATQGGNVVISGSGDHTFKSTSFDKTPLTFSGKVCPPVTYPRDIVFVIDVSGSMVDGFRRVGNDTMVANSCGRLKAVEAIVNDITARGGDSRFGIVTFSTGVVAKSSTMFSDRVNLFADIAKGGNIEDTLCAGISDTSYGEGLGAAEAILSGSRPGAVKEVYFVSDGVPTDGTAGATVAERLKNQGVVIEGKNIPVTLATAMLGPGDDTILKTQIASVDSNGAPMHVGSVQAAQLASTLSKLAENQITEGKMQYRPIGTDPWQEISLTQSLKDYSFSVPSITLDKSVAPKGLEVTFEYRDKKKNVYSSQGRILWSDAPVPKAALVNPDDGSSDQ